MGRLFYVTRFWKAHGREFLLGSGASLLGYFLVAGILGTYPRTLRGWALLLLASALIGAAFSARFFLRSLLPLREADTF